MISGAENWEDVALYGNLKKELGKHRKQITALMAGLTDRRWTVKDLLLYPLL